MYNYVNTATIDSIDIKKIKVEVDSSNGLPGVKIIGLPDAVVRESHFKVVSALKHCGFQLPMKRFIINFIPADIPKKGSGFDLPIAISLIKSIGAIQQTALNDHIFIGELSLTGELKHTTGILPVLLYAKTIGGVKVVIPSENIYEAEFFKDIAVPFDNINQIREYAEHATLPVITFKTDKKSSLQNFKDFEDVKGQHLAVRCAQISALGKHHLLLIGAPGCGKTMIGERIPGIMPELSDEEKVEVNSLYSIAGLLDSNLLKTRPFRSPHHTISDSSLIGGRTIGEVSLAHKGVLFLDELSEFKSNVLNALREPMESSIIDISRVNFKAKLPADFLLIGASNPCNCGNFLKKDGSCTCTHQQLSRYMKRLNGPLMDRFDIKIIITQPKISAIELNNKNNQQSSNVLKQQLLEAATFKESIKQKTDYLKITSSSVKLIDDYKRRYNSSIRNINKTINVARSIANLALSSSIKDEHVLESLNYTRTINWEL